MSADGTPEVDSLGLFSLAGKTALITGATGGIGHALAAGFAAAGARVYPHGRHASDEGRVPEPLRGRYLAADLEDPNQVVELVEQFRSQETRLDILVNNAGIEIPTTVAELDLEVVARSFRVDFDSAAQLTHLLLPSLRAAPSASVINVTSIHDHIPYRGNVAYTAAKAALAMFTKTAALELAGDGIRVNTLAPGAIETEINRGVIEEIGRERFNEWIPLGRVAQTTELVGPAIFLASDASSYVTGSSIVVDGGYSHHVVRYRIDE